MKRHRNISREASSRCTKRRRLLSFFEEKKGESSGKDVVVRSGTLMELDLLDCPVCFNPLSVPIFQCGNGHVACSSCCSQMNQKCPFCELPTGHYRCRVMEQLLEAITVPCRNAKHGCTEKLSYGKEVDHEKTCGFSPCYSCPAPYCNYSTGLQKDLYSHYQANHKNTMKRFFLNH